MASLFGGMSANRRFMVLSAIAALAVVGWLGIQQFATPKYVQLFTDLDLAESGSVRDALTKASIPNDLNAAGQVMVQEADLARARVALAKENLPLNGRPGLELFDRQSWGMTDFTQRVTYRRALEGELARTIGTLRGVQKAQVSLALPEASPLRSMDRSATASVVVSMRSGETLSADQVRGIAQLVSNAVERLPVDKVAVLDDSGRALAGLSAGDGTSALSSSQLDLQRSVEKQLAGKVEGLISAALGPGTSRVQVSALLNFAQAEQTVETYDPNGKVLQTEQRSTGGDTASAEGNQTVISNTYVNSRKIDKLISQTGNITRLTVAVLVDSAALGSTTAGFALRRQQLDTLVRNAVGADSSRGDVVSVVAVGFEKPVPPPAPPQDTVKVTVREMARDYGLPVVGLVAVIAALVLGVLALRPGRSRGTAVAAVASAGGTVTAVAGVGTAELPAATPSAANLELRDRAQAESLNSPDAAARALRSWLADGA